MFNNGVSLADIAAVTNRNNGDGWGNGGDWWAWIILFAFFGWGNNGWGGFGGNGGSYPTEAILQRSLDTQTIIGKLDGINSGICSLGYDQLAQQNATNNLITTTGYNTERAIQANTIANMQQFNAMAMAQQQCCCENRQMIADLKYDMATSDCAVKTLINQVARELQWGQQNGFRDLSDLINARFNELTIAQKDAVIAELQAKLNTCDRDTALQGMASYLISQLRPPAVPAYPASNPNGIGNWSPDVLQGGCFQNNSCCNRNNCC